MRFLRFQLECRSQLGTPLAADTLWGHIAWGIRYSEGEDALNDWLAAYGTDSPPLVLSDIFPAGMLPRPILPPPSIERVPDRQTLRKRKLAGRRRWIPTERWAQLASGLDSKSTAEAAADEMNPPVEAAVLHAGINRLTGGTAREDGGLLHSDVRSFFEEVPRFDLYVVSPAPQDVVERWLEIALAGGYGRDASSGLGDLRIVDCAQVTFDTPSGANAILLLAPSSLRPGEPCCGFSPIETKAGRLGGLFAIEPTPDGTMRPQKRPVTRLSCGSVLLTDTPPVYVGRLLAGVHDYEPIRHYAMSPVLPCRLTDDVLKEASA